MKVLMIGWELPPFHSGGLGVACYHLARHLAKKGVRISFVLPQKRDFEITDFELLFADIEMGGETLLPAYTDLFRGSDFSFGLLNQVFAYAQKILPLAARGDFDLIHAHDWLSFPAGMVAAEISGRPLVVHVHITEFDKTGGGTVDPRVYEIEKAGMEKADKIIAVSQMTKKRLIDFYQIDPEKIVVIHNGVVVQDWQGKYRLPQVKTKGKKIVLYLGRLTLQKGVDWLLQAAQKVLEVDPNVLFVLTGEGEMMPQLVEQAAQMGISDKIIFTGWLQGEDVVRIYKAADLYVLPSVSDPFGIVALEAMAAGTPVLVSRQAGVSEALKHALKVDFWDTNQMAAKILAVLKYKPLARALKENGLIEVRGLGWEAAAEKCLGIYKQLV